MVLELLSDIAVYELLTEERTLLCSTVTLLIALLIQVTFPLRLTSISEVTWRIPRSHDHCGVERYRSRRAAELNELVNFRYASYPVKCPWRNFMGSYSRFRDDGILRMHWLNFPPFWRSLWKEMNTRRRDSDLKYPKNSLTHRNIFSFQQQHLRESVTLSRRL